MAQAGLQVPHVRFSTVLRGADPDEVERVIAAAHQALADTRAEVETFKGRLRDAKAATSGAAPPDDGTVEIIRQAEADAEARRARARRLAAQIVYTAEEQAQTLVRALEHDRDALAHQIAAAAMRQAWAVRALTGLVDDAAEQVLAYRGGEQVSEQALSIDARAEVEAIAQLLGQAIAHEQTPGAGRDAVSGLEPAGAIAPGSPVEAPQHAPSGPNAPRRWKPALAAAAAMLLLTATTAVVGRRMALPAEAQVVTAGISGVPVSGAFARPASPGTRAGAGAASSTAAPAHAAPLAAGTTEPSSPLRVHLVAERECWVRIVADGKAEERVLATGDEAIRSARHSVVLRIGDAGAVRLSVNGAPQPRLGRDGQVVQRRFAVGE